MIWASVGVCCLVLSITIAGFRRDWTQARVATIPVLILFFGLITTHFSNLAHTYSTWFTVVVALWAAHRTTKETSLFLFLGAVGLGAAGIIASTQLF